MPIDPSDTRIPVIALTGPQAEFLESTARYPAFVAGFGAGKSEVMAYSAIGDASHSATALIGCYAPTYDLIRLITAPRLIEKLTELGIPHRHNKQENIIYTSYPRFGDFVLRTLDTPARIVGYETYRSHIDELDTLRPEHARDAWNKIIARNRQKPDGIADPFNRVSAYTTPEGFRFVYDRWVAVGGPDYQVIHASTYSNPTLPPEYIPSLRATYPENLIDAYIEGKFVNLTSGSVYRNYDRIKHRTAETIRNGDDLLIGMDFNVDNMAAAVFVKRPTGMHCVDEIIGAKDTPDMIDAINARWPERKIFVYPDASGSSRKSVDASKSDIKLLRGAGFGIRVRSRNPLVKDRVLSVNAGYSNGKIWINDTKAPTIASAQEHQSYGKSGEPDKTTGHDHPNDAFGYAVCYELPIVKHQFTVRGLEL